MNALKEKLIASQTVSVVSETWRRSPYVFNVALFPNFRFARDEDRAQDELQCEEAREEKD